MASTYSFDIVSEINMQEVDNAINQSTKEISQRYDFKGCTAEITLNSKDQTLTLHAQDDYKLKAMIEILKGKLIKRGISPKALDFGKTENASMGSIKQVAKLAVGISKEKAKEISKAIKNSKLKVQTQIMDEKLRVSAKNKDDLQTVIALVKDGDFGIPVQFTNYR